MTIETTIKHIDHIDHSDHIDNRVPAGRAATSTLIDPSEIDRDRLVADLGRLAIESRARKRRLRSTWIEPMADVQRGHERLRARITELCVLRAAMRGRYHHRMAPRSVADSGESWNPLAYHRAIARRVAIEYRCSRPAGVDAGGEHASA